MAGKEKQERNLSVMPRAKVEVKTKVEAEKPSTNATEDVAENLLNGKEEDITIEDREDEDYDDVVSGLSESENEGLVEEAINGDAKEKAEPIETNEKVTRPRHRQVAKAASEVVSGDLTERASRRAKRRIYTEDQIFTIDPSAPATSEADERRAVWHELQQAAETGNPLTGVLVSCKNIDGRPCGIVNYKNIARVIIPAEWLYVFDEKTVRARNGESSAIAKFNTQAYFVNIRFGMEVNFVVLQAKEDDEDNPGAGPVAIGSRVDAMQRISRDYFITKQADGDPQLYEGLLAEAKITYLSKTGVGVEVFGTEAFISAEELSWSRISDARYDAANYYVGKIIPVKILSVSQERYTAYGKNFNLVMVEVSAKQAVKDPNKLYFNAFTEGQRSLAEVTQITDDGIFVKLEGKRDAICGWPQGGLSIPPIGSLVQVKIVRKEESNYHIRGEIKGIVRNGKAIKETR